MHPAEQVKPPPPQTKKANLEDTLSNLAQFVNETRTSLTSQASQLQNLEVQMGQMDSMLNERQQGNMLGTQK